VVVFFLSQIASVHSNPYRSGYSGLEPIPPAYASTSLEVADPADEIVSSLDVELFTASHIITIPVYVQVIRSEDGHYQKTVWSIAYIICRPAWWIFAALVTYPSVYTA